MDLSNNKIDSSAEKDGVWVDIDEKTSLLIARFNNPKYKAYVRRKFEARRKLSRTTGLSDEATEKITTQAMAHTVLLDWRGLEDSGVEIPYSTEKAIELLSDETLPWFFDFVYETANDFQLYREHSIAEGEDNIKKLSPGTSNGEAA